MTGGGLLRGAISNTICGRFEDCNRSRNEINPLLSNFGNITNKIVSEVSGPLSSSAFTIYSEIASAADTILCVIS